MEIYGTKAPQPYSRRISICQVCSVNYDYLIEKEKKLISYLILSLYKGEMQHYASKQGARRWTGMYKKKATEILKGKMPFAARLEFASKGDVEAIKCGKLTSVKTVKTYSNIKYKVQKFLTFNIEKLNFCVFHENGCVL